jgi:hypothetical protein
MYGMLLRILFGCRKNSPLRVTFNGGTWTGALSREPNFDSSGFASFPSFTFVADCRGDADNDDDDDEESSSRICGILDSSDDGMTDGRGSLWFSFLSLSAVSSDSVRFPLCFALCLCFSFEIAFKKLTKFRFVFWNHLSCDFSSDSLATRAERGATAILGLGNETPCSSPRV